MRLTVNGAAGAFPTRQKAERNKTDGAEKVAPESGSAEPRAGVTFAAQGDLFSAAIGRAGKTPDCGEAPAGKTRTAVVGSASFGLT